MAIRLTFKIRAAGEQWGGGTMVVMFYFFIVSCVFVGVQWQLVVESTPLVSADSKKRLHT
jgi:hypothetical protein